MWLMIRIFITDKQRDRNQNTMRSKITTKKTDTHIHEVGKSTRRHKNMIERKKNPLVTLQTLVVSIFIYRGTYTGCGCH